MAKRKELMYAVEGILNPFFVVENSDLDKIYLTDQKRFDNANSDELINCQVLEFEEYQDQIIYRRKEPEMFVDIQRSLLSGLLLT
ncbi:hypothetical protein [Aquimarina sediminis]|uniref:hypothetical protein n=1 Tax=Aquimarina sediminis TaxID=2070536 RepID=UPI000CA04695|nr:hypothetical protein [Aquimarina sediminis]